MARMRRWKRTDPYFTVTRTDTKSGFGVKALDHAEAVARALKYPTMKGATTLSVRLFAGSVNGSRDTSPILFNV